jgi:membrane-bound ClpP family serine protease
VKLDDGQLIDVVAEGAFIEKGNSVRVADCAGGRVVVRRETPA